MIEESIDSKLVEERQRQSEIIVSSTTGIIALLDKNYTYLTANPAYLRIVKKTYEQVIGKKAVSLFGEAFFNKVIKPNGDRCLRGEEVHFEEWFDFPASGKRCMEIHYYPHFGVN
jgi:PAS domain-containing protein